MSRYTPTADVVEVRHGEWLTRDIRGADEIEVKCSVCKSKVFYPLKLYSPSVMYPNYCSVCGAKMDGERREANEG